MKAFKSAGLKQSVLMILGNGVATGISALSLILFSRVLGPESFGIFSIGFSIMQLVVRLSDFGVNVAVQRSVAPEFETDEKKTRGLLAAGTRYKLIFSLVMVFIGLWLSPVIAGVWLKTENIKIVKLGILLSVLTVWFEYIAVILQSMRKFVSSVVMSVAQALAKLAGAVWFFVGQISDAVLSFWVYGLAPLVGVVIGGVLVPKWAKWTVFEKPVYGPIKKVVKFTSISVIAAAIGDNIDVLMVKSFLTSYETGLFAAGARISLLISIVAYSLGTVLSPRVARYKTKEHFSSYLKKSILLIMVLLVTAIIVIPLAGPLVWLTAGPSYMEATRVVAFLLVSGMVVVSTTPIVAMFYSLKNPEYFAYSGILQTVVLITANLILIPMHGIEGAGMAKLIARVSVFVFSIWFAIKAMKKQFNIRLIDELASSRSVLGSDK